MPGRPGVPVDGRVDVVDADRQGVRLGHDELDQLQVVGRAVAFRLQAQFSLAPWTAGRIVSTSTAVPLRFRTIWVRNCPASAGNVVSNHRKWISRTSVRSTGHGSSEPASASSQRNTFSPLCWISSTVASASWSNSADASTAPGTMGSVDSPGVYARSVVSAPACDFDPSASRMAVKRTVRSPRRSGQIERSRRPASDAGDRPRAFSACRDHGACLLGYSGDVDACSPSEDLSSMRPLKATAGDLVPALTSA